MFCKCYGYSVPSVVREETYFWCYKEKNVWNVLMGETAVRLLSQTLAAVKTKYTDQPQKMKFETDFT